MAETDDTGFEPEVMHFFTSTKRIPMVIGKITAGVRLPFGPYTFTQLAVGVAVFGLVQTFSWLLPIQSSLGKSVLAVILALVATFLVTQLPRASRNVLLVSTDYVRALVARRGGLVNGSSVSIRSGRWVAANSSRLVSERREDLGLVDAGHELALPAVAAPEQAPALPVPAAESAAEAEVVTEPLPASAAVTGVERLRMLAAGKK